MEDSFLNGVYYLILVFWCNTLETFWCNILENTKAKWCKNTHGKAQAEPRELGTSFPIKNIIKIQVTHNQEENKLE